MPHPTPVVIAANRGPLRRREGRWKRSSGGLVTALHPILEARGGVWVSSDPAPPEHDLGYTLASVELESALADDYYLGLSNSVLWPVFHGFPSTIRLGTAPIDAYRRVNRAFAEEILTQAPAGAPVWVHDYHLLLVPRALREVAPRRPIGWFCHIPWPSEEAFRNLPWARELLEGLLGADVLGFHIQRYARNFLRCAQAVLGAEIDWEGYSLRHGGRETRVDVAPIGVPTEEFSALANSPEVRSRAAQLRNSFEGRAIILGVDRLDYSKGIPERMLAFDRLLTDHPELCRACVLVQVMVPSRIAVDAYAELKEEVDRLIGKITGRHGRTGIAPIHYHSGSLDRPELVAHYQAASVGLVTPLRDGMNLVAQEYAISHPDDDGALVLSEFAGAAELLPEALQVNPYDVEATAKALRQALTMHPEERQHRIRRVKQAVRDLDVHRWAHNCLRSVSGASSPTKSMGRGLEAQSAVSAR